LVNDELTDTGDGFGGVSVFDNDGFGGTVPSDASVRVLRQPGEGFVVIEADGTVSFTPNSQFEASSGTEFTYVFERGGETSTATVELRTLGGQDNGSSESSNDPASDDPGEGAATPANGQIATTDGPPVSTNENQNPGSVSNLTQRAITAGVFTNGSGADTFSNDFSDIEFENDFSLLTTKTDYSTYLYSSFVDTGLLTGEFASRIATSGRQGLQDLAEGAILNVLFWQELETTNHEYIQTELGEFETAITVGALSFSGVAITVVVRAALLGLSLGATYAQPWWMTSFDFLPIIDSEDSESIGQIVDRED